MKIPNYSRLARLVAARQSCIASNNAHWLENHTTAIHKIVKEHFPSGSGFDSGTKFSFEESTPEKLIFYTAFHHMNENGFYDGWTEHKIVVKPSLCSGFSLSIGGRDRNGIKYYIHECFSEALSLEIETNREEN